MSLHVKLENVKNNEELKAYDFIHSQRVVDPSDLIQFSRPSYVFHKTEDSFSEIYTFTILSNPIPMRLNFPKKTFILKNIIENIVCYTCKTMR